MRRLPLIMFLLACAGAAHAANATYRVTLAKGTDMLFTKDLVVALGAPAALTHSVPFRMAGACAAAAGGHPDHLSGTGHSAQTVTVKPIAITPASVTTVVTLANSQLISTVPTAVGTCKAATPGMLKWSASAKFDLAPGAANTFAVGEYTVVLTLIQSDPRSAARGMTI